MKSILRLKNKYLKQNVIWYAAYADKVSRQMVKQEIINFRQIFFTVQASEYFSVKFFAYLSQQCKIDTQFFSKVQLEAYNEAKQRMKNFAKLNQFLDMLDKFGTQLYYLQSKTQMNYSTSNILSSRDDLPNYLKQDIKIAIEKYKNLIQNLKQYPEWQQKVKQELGHKIHIIYNSIVKDSDKMQTFANFDYHYYFK